MYYRLTFNEWKFDLHFLIYRSSSYRAVEESSVLKECFIGSKCFIDFPSRAFKRMDRKDLKKSEEELRYCTEVKCVVNSKVATLREGWTVQVIKKFHSKKFASISRILTRSQRKIVGSLTTLLKQERYDSPNKALVGREAFKPEVA